MTDKHKLAKMENEAEKITFVKESDFLYVNKSFKFCSVKLSDRAIYISHNNTHFVTHILLDDIIGCRILPNVVFAFGTGPSSSTGTKLTEHENSHKQYLHIFSYPLSKSKFGNLRRKRLVHIFAGTVSECRTLLEDWRHAILKQTKCFNSWQDNQSDAFKTKKLLVLVNPASGQGKAHAIYNKLVVHMLNEAEVQHDLIVTEKANHAFEIAQSLNKNDWCGILTVSGDGLLHEVVNGLMQREDSGDAITLPIGIIAGGSGNALACSLNYYAGEPYTSDLSLHSCFTFLKQRPTLMDLVLIQTPTQTIYSFLSITLAIIADCDYESEAYRKLGNMRFTVAALKRFMFLKLYRFRISYLPMAEYIPATPPKKKRTLKKIRSFRFMAKPANEDKNEDITESTEENNTKNNSQSVLSNMSENSVVDRPGVEKSDTEPDVCDEDKIEHEDIVVDKTETGNTSLLVPLDQPVPDTWDVIEDDFVSVNLSCQGLLGPEFLHAPDYRLNSGVIDLFFVTKNVTKMRLMKLMGMMKDGSHVDEPEVMRIKVLAFRVEPIDCDGILMVDGEQQPLVPIQGQVLPGFARIMTINPS